jgi:hypothetical protein
MNTLLCDLYMSRCVDNNSDYTRGLAPFATHPELHVIVDEVYPGGKSRMIDKYLELTEVADPVRSERIISWLRLMREANKLGKRHVVPPRLRSTGAIFLHIISERNDIEAVFAAKIEKFKDIEKRKVKVLGVDLAFVAIIDHASNGQTDREGAKKALTQSVVLNIINLEGGLTVGDTFSGITNSTIINRSRFVAALNVVQEANPEVAKALDTLAAHIEKEGNTKAGEIIEALTAEVSKGRDKANPTIMGSLWKGLKEAASFGKDLTSAVKTVGDWIG